VACQQIDLGWTARSFYAGQMRRLMISALIAAALSFSAHAATGRIIKTLPHLLDSKGRHTIYPSLFERDFYQADLRKHPEKCSGIRFDVQWKARKTENKLRLKVELRGTKTPPRQLESFEKEIAPRAVLSRWTPLTIEGPAYERVGSVTAWRVTLWDGEQQLAEEKSFLW
jgi:hypothetical protein